MSLESRFKDVLLKLEVVSHGTVQSFGHSTKGGEGVPWPAGCKGAEHLHFAGLWGAARSQEERENVLGQALECWEALTGRSRRVKVLQAVAQEESKTDRDAKIVKVGEGWSVREAAVHFRCAEADVRKARLGADREPILGLLVVARVKDKPAELERVRLLHEGGHTERQIVSITRIPKSTVRRYLGKAA